MLDKLALTIRERLKIRKQVQVYTAQGRLSGYVLGTPPLLVFGVFGVLNPEYEMALIKEPMGIYILVFALAMQIVGLRGRSHHPGGLPAGKPGRSGDLDGVHPGERSALLRKLRQLATASAACLAASLVNPFGYRILLFPFQLVSDQFIMPGAGSPLPVWATVGDQAREAVIEKASEGVQRRTCRGFIGTGELHPQGLRSRPGEKVARLGSRTITGKTVLARILMPEAVLWDDDNAFTGSLQDSDSTTKFNSETGLYWKEYDH